MNTLSEVIQLSIGAIVGLGLSSTMEKTASASSVVRQLLLNELEAYEAKHFLSGGLEREFVETSGGNDDSLSRF